MQYRIVHTGEDIHWVGNDDYPGATALWKPASECGDVMAHPTWYKVDGQNVVLRDDWETIRDAEAQAAQDKLDRITAIISARDTSGVRELTVAQAETYIDNQLDTTDLDATGADIDAATTVAQLRVATKAAMLELRKLHKNTETVLKKMVPYLLQ